MSKDNLSSLFQHVDLDEPKGDFCDKVMDKIEAYAQPNKISLSTFMILILSAATIISSTLAVVFWKDIVFFIQRFIAPYVLRAMRFLNTTAMSLPEINTVTLVMTIVSCVALVLAIVQFFVLANKKRHFEQRER